MRYLLLSLLFLLAFAACEQDRELEPPILGEGAATRYTDGDLTFTLQVTDMQGTPQAVFEQGENVHFQLVMENAGDSVHTLPKDRYMYDFPDAYSEFFALYRVEEGPAARTNERMTLLGKSFRARAISIILRYPIVPPGGKIVYEAPWLLPRDSVFYMPTHFYEDGFVETSDWVHIHYQGRREGDHIDYDNLEETYDGPTTPLASGTYYTSFVLHYTPQDSVLLEASFSVR